MLGKHGEGLSDVAQWLKTREKGIIRESDLIKEYPFLKEKIACLGEHAGRDVTVSLVKEDGAFDQDKAAAFEISSRLQEGKTTTKTQKFMIGAAAFTALVSLWQLYSSIQDAAEG